MSGILNCKHPVKWTKILCVKNVNCLHYQRWVCTEESKALTQSLVLWDVFKAKLDFPKNSIVTNSSSPTFLWPVGAGVSSQAWHTPWLGSKPKHSHGHLLSLTPEHHHFVQLHKHQKGCWNQKGLLSAYHKHLQRLLGCHTNPALLKSPGFSSSSTV